jgi:hypothetical protein
MDEENDTPHVIRICKLYGFTSYDSTRQHDHKILRVMCAFTVL